MKMNVKTCFEFYNLPLTYNVWMDNIVKHLKQVHFSQLLRTIPPSLPPSQLRGPSGDGIVLAGCQHQAVMT